MGQKSTTCLMGQKSRYWKGCTFSKQALRVNLLAYLLQFLEITHIPWLVLSSLTFKASSTASSNLAAFLFSKDHWNNSDNPG